MKRYVGMLLILCLVLNIYVKKLKLDHNNKIKIHHG